MWCLLRSQQTHEERNVEVFIWNLPWLKPNIRGTNLSSIPLSFQFFLTAFSLPFLFFSFYMFDLLLKSISQEWKWNPAFCITTCKTGGRMGRRFMKKNDVLLSYRNLANVCQPVIYCTQISPTDKNTCGKPRHLYVHLATGSQRKKQQTSWCLFTPHIWKDILLES